MEYLCPDMCESLYIFPSFSVSARTNDSCTLEPVMNIFIIWRHKVPFHSRCCFPSELNEEPDLTAAAASHSSGKCVLHLHDAMVFL